LKQQQRESEEDARWLQAEEKNLKRDRNIGKSQPTPGASKDNVKENSPPFTNSNLPDWKVGDQDQPDWKGGDQVKMQRMSSSSRSSTASESTETMPGVITQISRMNNGVYDSTTNVVRAVMSMTKEAPLVDADKYVDMVKRIGNELRTLLAAVDEVLPQLPPDNHKQVDMAQKVLSTDMGSLINAMRLAQTHTHSSLFPDYRKSMLKAAHALAMDSKNLLDAVDSARPNNT